MDREKDKMMSYIVCNNGNEVVQLLNKGFNPNYESGWPIRLAARKGYSSIVNTFIQHGASPHLLSESGASTLQLAVYSGLHWDTDEWKMLLSCCDSSQLADGAAVAIIFHNTAALRRILETGRCNVNIPTSLTQKTVTELATGYKLNYLLNTTNATVVPQVMVETSPRNTQVNRSREVLRSGVNVQPQQRNLSPSVAHFFDLTSRQPSLTPPQSPVLTMLAPYTNLQTHQ